MIWRTYVNRALLALSVLTGLITHGYNLFNYPLLEDGARRNVERIRRIEAELRLPEPRRAKKP